MIRLITTISDESLGHILWYSVFVFLQVVCANIDCLTLNFLLLYNFYILTLKSPFLLQCDLKCLLQFNI